MDIYKYEQYVDKLNNLAEDIIKVFEVKAPVTDMRILVEKLGGKIIINDIHNGLISDIAVRRDGPESFTVMINQNDNEKDSDRNWVLGKCLGIAIINMGYLIDPDTWNKYNTKTFYKLSNFNKSITMVSLNNMFCLALMFPKTMFTRLMEKYKDGDKVDMRNVANELNYPLTPVISRAEDLHLIRKWYEHDDYPLNR